MDTLVLSEYTKQTGNSQADPLTGAYNHAVFQILFTQEVERYKRYGKNFALLFVDVDWFSLFNSRHGPIQGDRTLQILSQTIYQNIRSVDSVSRYAADCFGVLLPETNDAGAMDVAERIHRSFTAMIKEKLTISIGIAACPHDGKDKNALIACAQNALRTAKIRGKNQIYINKRVVDNEDEDKATVLLADDDRMNLKLMKGILTKGNYKILTASNGKEALHACEKFEIDLIISDIMMPEMDGFEVCQRLKSQERSRLIPVILITAMGDSDSRLKGIRAGADDFISRPPNHAELLARSSSLIKVNQLNKSLTNVENVLFSMASAVEAKDKYTQGHIERVANLAVSMGRAMALSTKEIKALHYGGVLHDIGKLGIPHEILNKPGPLDEKELKKMKQHPEIGYKICMPLGSTLGSALDVIRYHHEKMDGSGYPYGLKGDEIPIVARVMAIADIYDALVTDRPYRKGMDHDRAMAIMIEDVNTGKLDIKIFDVFTQLLTSKIA